MKCFVYDNSNQGIIWIGGSIPVGNKLKQGILDSEFTLIIPGHPIYNSINKDDLANTNWHWDHKNHKITIIDDHNINPLYLENKRIILMRGPVMGYLYGLIHWALRKTKVFPVDGIDNDINFSLQQCDPKNNIYSYSVIEYATICKMPHKEAYKQLKLQVENIQSQKLRIYSYADYFSDKVNQCQTQQELDLVKEEMFTKFVKDSYI
jgi:hypothetical protein